LFDRLILIEGGFDEWDVRIAMRFKKAGGVRVLLACGNDYCARHARESARRLRRGGIDARVEHAPGGGHTYDGEVGERVLAALDWVTAGDPRWK
jgi:hypothetical protein